MSIYDNIDRNIDLPKQIKDEEIVKEENRTGGTRVDNSQVSPVNDLVYTRSDDIFSLYRPNSPDRSLMDMFDQEMIEIFSPPIKYYELIRVDANIYGEQIPNKTFKSPVIIHGIYSPPTPSIEMTEFGIDQLEEIEIRFNYNYLLRKIGHHARIGDYIMTYDGKLWHILSSVLQEEPLWRVMNNICRCTRVQPDGVKLPDIEMPKIAPKVY